MQGSLKTTDGWLTKTLRFNWYRVWLGQLDLRKQVILMFNKVWNHCLRVSVWEWVCALSVVLDIVKLFPMRNVQEFQLLVASDLHQYMACLIHFFGNINFIVCEGSCDFNHLLFFVSFHSSFYHSFNAAIMYLSMLLFYLNLFSPYNFLFQKGHVFLYPIVDAKKFLNIFLLI